MTTKMTSKDILKEKKEKNLLIKAYKLRMLLLLYKLKLNHKNITEKNSLTTYISKNVGFLVRKIL